MTDDERERALRAIQHIGPEPTDEEIRDRAKRARKRLWDEADKQMQSELPNRIALQMKRKRK